MKSEEIWKKVTDDEMEEFAKHIGFKKVKGILIDDTHDIKQGEPSFFEYQFDGDVITDIHLDAIVWIHPKEEGFYGSAEEVAEAHESDLFEWYEKRHKQD